MKSIVYINFMLVFFVYIILNSILYMMIMDYFENKFSKKVAKLSEASGKEILEHLNKLKNNMYLTRTDIKKMKKKLKNRAYERVFNDTIISYNENSENHIYVKEYMGYFDRYIQRIIKKNSKEGRIKNVYTAFLVGQYKLDKEFINKFLLDSLKSDSLYLRFNALNSIGQIGNIQCFIKALTSISQLGGYLNAKILIDIMDQFNGDVEELDVELLENFEDFSIGIQCIIINHFSNVDNVSIAPILVNILSVNDTDKEVKANILKYFHAINYPKAKKILIKILDSEQWECRALAAKTLSKYYSEITVKQLLISITDPNWYVRLNSAMSLIDFDLGDKLMYSVLEKKDKYSTEILFYAMFVKNKITYQEYIEQTAGYEEVAVF